MSVPLALADSDYYYQQALRKRDRTPGSVRALPTTQDIDLAYITAETRKAEEARQFGEKIAMGRKSLAELSRQHDARMGFRYELLDDAKKANRWATGISLANLGVAGIGAKISLEEAKKQELLNLENIRLIRESNEIRKKNLELLRPFYEGQISALNSEFNEKEFQSWYKTWAEKIGINPNPDDPGHHYDYRAAYKAGIEPVLSPEDNRYHWDSRFKAAGHPNRYIGGVDTRVEIPR